MMCVSINATPSQVRGGFALAKLCSQRRSNMHSTDPFERISEAVAEATKDLTFGERLVVTLVTIIVSPLVLMLFGATLRYFLE